MIFDLVMPNVSGEEAARMIRSTSNPNADTPSKLPSLYDRVSSRSPLISCSHRCDCLRLQTNRHGFRSHIFRHLAQTDNETNLV